MRISDWSSDVCSSDLPRSRRRPDTGASRTACRGRSAPAASQPQLYQQTARPSGHRGLWQGRGSRRVSFLGSRLPLSCNGVGDPGREGGSPGSHGRRVLQGGSAHVRQGGGGGGGGGSGGGGVVGRGPARREGEGGGGGTRGSV